MISLPTWRSCGQIGNESVHRVLLKSGRKRKKCKKGLLGKIRCGTGSASMIGI